MVIYGVGILAICYLVGLIVGEGLGYLAGVDANVGGVGFAMLFLIFATDKLRDAGLFPEESEQGVLFWSAMYIPIIIAMAMIQNVTSALSGGAIAVIAGVGGTLACVALVPFVGRIGGREAPLPPLVVEAV